MSQNIEWLNQNANRNYPFQEDMSRSDSLGIVQLPNYLVVDMVFVVPADVNQGYYLGQLLYSGSTLVLVFNAEDGTIWLRFVNIDSQTFITLLGEPPCPI